MEQVFLEQYSESSPLREKCPNKELSFLWSLFSCIPNEYGALLRIQSKYGPEKTPYLDTFHAVLGNQLIILINF